MNAPNFICIGAQKAGTTLLFDILKRHPDIYLPDVKELHFFDRDEEYTRGLAWYQAQYFRDVRHHRAIGEITPSYIYFETVPERIFKTLGPNIKLILLLRNPLDRAISHYWMQFKRGYETMPLMKALMVEQTRINEDYLGKRRFSYISRGFYARQIKRYLEYFPPENLKIIFFEDLIADLSGRVRDIVEFLECDPDRLPDPGSTGKINSSRLTFSQYLKAVVLNWPYVAINFPARTTRDYPALKMKYRQMIMNHYLDDIDVLKSLTNRDLSVWRIKR